MTREKPKNMKRTVLKLIKYIGSSKYLVMGLLFVMIFTTLLNLLGPVLQQKAIDSLSVDFGTGKVGVDFETLGYVLLLMVITYAVSSLLTYLQNVYAAKLSMSTVYTMRKDLFKKISYLPMSPGNEILHRIHCRIRVVDQHCIHRIIGTPAVQQDHRCISIHI